MTDEKLIEAAREAAANSYSPYSGFAVGAALRFADGAQQVAPSTHEPRGEVHEARVVAREGLTVARQAKRLVE